MKAKFHYYMAKLLYAEICLEVKGEDGKANVKEKGDLPIKDLKTKMSEQLRDAIMANEKAFLAGSLGPDFYPDMLMGKLRIHPKKNINPGLWLVMMIEDFRNNYNPAKSDNKDAGEVFAFIAGWMTHYACDVFMNTYVNHVTSGHYGDDAKTPPDSKEAKVFFQAVETYLELKLKDNKFLVNPQIKAPFDFLKRFFLDDRRVSFSSASSRSEFIFKKPKEDKTKPYMPGFTSAKTTTDTKADKDKKNEPAPAEETPEEVAMLDFSEESFDIFFLLGGIRKAFYYDEKAPYYEQMEIGKKVPVKRDRQESLKNADTLICDWLSLFEKLAGDFLTIKNDDAGAVNERLAQFKLDLDEFEKKLKTIMNECTEVFKSDGLPQWLLDYLLRNNALNLGGLTGAFKTGEGSPFSVEVGIKITGPYSPLVKQTNKIIANMCSDMIPKMMEKIYKNIKESLQGGDPELILAKKWDKEKFDKLLGDFGPKDHFSNNQTFTPFIDALMLAKLCLIGKGFDKVVADVHKNSHKYIQWLYPNPKKGEFDLIEPKSFPAATQRLRANLESGGASVNELSVMYGPNDLLTTTNKNAYNHIYLQFEKYTKYNDVISVSFTVIPGSAKGTPEKTPEEKTNETPNETPSENPGENSGGTPDANLDANSGGTSDANSDANSAETSDANSNANSGGTPDANSETNSGGTSDANSDANQSGVPKEILAGAPDAVDAVKSAASQSDSQNAGSDTKPEEKKDETPSVSADEKAKTIYKIIIEVEDLRFKGNWKPLVIIEGALTSVSECKVEYTKNLSENVEQSPPKVDSSDGKFHITIPITYKKLPKEEKKKKPLDEYDVYLGVFNFVKSLEAGCEWQKLENDHPAYFYFLKSLMHLSDECYR